MSEYSKSATSGEYLFARGLRTWWRSLLRGRNGENSVREAIEELIEDSDESDGEAIDGDERALIHNILKLHDLAAEDVMIPRAEIIAADVSTSLREIVDIMAHDAHSRLPVFRDNLDDVIGFVHIKDVLACLGQDQDVEIKDLVREILFAAPSIRVLDLLLEMRASRVHMAIVVDEFGGVDGLVTIENLVEEIVGEIEDEHDDEGPSVIQRPDGVIVADARTEIEDLESLTGPFAAVAERDELGTIGGIVFKLLNRVPRRGEVIQHPSGVEFEVIDADARRIKRLSVRVPSEIRERAAVDRSQR